MVGKYENIVGYNTHVLDTFDFENGCILENVEVEYAIYGTPKYDCDGKIVNAVIYCHKFDGNYYSYKDEYPLDSVGEPFDENEYCFISITSLGFSNSCSPSSTGLKHSFPPYTIKDRVNFKRQFLKDKFNMEKVHGIAGRGAGGYEVLTWACEYPDEMDFLIVANTSFKTNGYRYVLSKAVDSIIDSNDDFYDEIYSESLSKIMVSIYRLLYSNHFSKQIFQKMSNEEIDVMMDDFVDEGLFTDIYDFKFRNDCILNYDVEDKLDNIKAKAFIMISANDLYFSYEFDALPLKKIENSKIVLLELKKDDSGYEDYSSLSDEFNEFLKEFKEH